MREQRESERQRLVGGELCLDFANTVNGHTRPNPHEYLQDYRDLVLWGKHAGILNSGETEKLLREARANILAAKEVLKSGLELRETIFRTFSAITRGKEASEQDLQKLNAAWREGMGHTRLIRSGRGFDLAWDDEPCLESPLRAVTASAVRLLTSSDVHQVRQCAGEGCDWLFVDLSRNHLRKWCSMEECGNRAKMKRRRIKKAQNLLV
jgi:predicted RNA-binding Zn ribbon-like protein